MAKFHQTTLSGSSADPTPTSYQINEIYLYDNNENQWDIRSIITSIEIYESLYTSSIEVTLSVADGISLLEQALITGNEKISIKVQQTQVKDDSETRRKFELDVYIAEVINFSRAVPGLQTYQFVCFSEHMYINSVSRLNRSFENTLGSLVKIICERDLRIEPNYINESSKGIIKGIYPRLRPLSAINWLMRNAVEDNTPFYFYETAFNGVNFDSYKNIVQQDVYREYNHKPEFSLKPLTPKSYEEIASRIRKFSSTLNLSKLASLSEGAYSATLHEIDIATKSYTKRDLRYDKDIKYKLNEHKPFNDNVQFKDLKFNDSIDSIHYYINQNSKAFSQKNYHSPASPTIMSRQSYLENIDLLSHSLTIAGDFELTPGKVIALLIPKSTDTESLKLDPRDRILSGKHVVTSIEHRFSNSEYTMNIVVQKDSFEFDLQGDSNE